MNNTLFYESIDSTNEEAKRLAASGAADRTVIFAKSQTNGRGRYGRQWISDVGNFYASILLRPNFDTKTAPQLSFIAALAARDAISSLLADSQISPPLLADNTISPPPLADNTIPPPLLAGGDKGVGVSAKQISNLRYQMSKEDTPNTNIKFKWPNDLLLNGKKLGGILLEASGRNPLDYLIIGVGININSFPEETEFPATSLINEGILGIEPENILGQFTEAFFSRMEEWLQNGFSASRECWLKNAYKLGEEIIARTAKENFSGIFKNITDDGALVLKCDDKERSITVADVFF